MEAVRVELALVTVIYKVMEEQVVVTKFFVIDNLAMVKSINALRRHQVYILNLQEIGVLNS